MARVFLLAAALLLGPTTAAAQVAYTWGYNDAGQLGTGGSGPAEYSTVPVAVVTDGVLAGKVVAAVGGGSNHSFALANGRVYTWGANGSGQLGNNSSTGNTTPVTVSTAGVLGTQTVTAVAGGGSYNLALANGKVYAWGNNFYGSLGNGTNTNSTVPVAVSTAGVLNGQTITAVTSGGTHGLVVANGQAFAWGNNFYGQLGNGTTAHSNIPVPVSTAGALNGQTVTAVAGGVNHSLALANGQVYAWGFNFYGQLGTGTTADSSVPVVVSTAGALNGLTVTAIAAGGNHNLAVANGKVYSWGANFSGQLGTGTTADSSVPVAISSTVLDSLTVTQVAAVSHSSYALTDTGRLFAWGDNAQGKLGTGITGGVFSTPQEVLAPAGYVWTGFGSNAYGGHVVAIATPVPEPIGLLAVGLVVVGLARGTTRSARPPKAA